jgi:hypothetical protein
MDQKVMPVAGQIRKVGKIAQILLEQVFANFDPQLQERNRRFEFADGCGNGRALGLLLRQLAIDLGKLGICSATWLFRKCRCISTSAGLAASGGLKASRGSATGSVTRCRAFKT